MNFCSVCGTPLEPGTKFCSKCGAPIPETSASGSPVPYAGAQRSYSTDYQEIERPVMDKGLASIVVYLSWIGFLIGMIAGDRKDSYLRPHCNQALVLHLSSIICGILYAIGTGITMTSMYSYYYGYSSAAGGVVLLVIAAVIGIFTFVCYIIAIVRACKGIYKPLPLFGKIKLLK